MKKQYILIAGMLLAATSSFAQNGNLSNGGFENWSNVTIYDYPTDWQNSNQQEFRGGATTLKSTDAQDGMFSVELGAFVTPQSDTVSGYVFHGIVGQNGPQGGIPYTDNFNSVHVQYKCDLQPGDTANLVIMRSLGGVLGGMQVYPMATGTQANWTEASITVSAGTQDSLFIGFILGSVNGNYSVNPASWVRLDAVAMYDGTTAVADVPDPSFENWSEQTFEEPDSWYTLNNILAPMGLQNAIKTIDANSGTYAIEMTTFLEPQSGDTISSFISTAPINIFGGNPFSLSPYNATPTTFSGAYKYAPANGDQGVIQIQFFANGNVVGSHTEPLGNQPSWQTFSSALTVLSAPDSISFIAFAGANPGSVLKLDDLAFSGGNVSLNEFTSMNVSVYPNPASSTVMLKATGVYSYNIIDLTGNVVLSENEVNGAVQLDISSLSAGAYLVKIENAGSLESVKLIVE